MGHSPAQIANASRTFVLAFERCMMQRPLPDGRFEMPLVPGVVCLAFSIELGLKAMAAQGGLALKGHRLADLFGKIPSDAQAAIVAETKVDRQRFEIEMEAVSEVFVEWRYVYEQPSANLNLAFLQSLGGAVQRLIAGLR